MARNARKKKTRRSFAGIYFPYHPERVIKKSYAIERRRRAAAGKHGPARASNKAYVKWLVGESMLENAVRQAVHYSGTSTLWQNPYAEPRPRDAIGQADVWYTAYPISMIAPDGTSILATLGDESLWKCFEEIGITGVHTGPMKRAGGIQGWQPTPSVDGHFDRISNKVDPYFGSEDDFRALCEAARAHGGIVIDDIIPGHTGKGPDFRLAEMSHGDYPGIYHMVEIDPRDWGSLPDVPPGRDSVNLGPEIEAKLKSSGNIIGPLERVIFYERGVKETNWSVTRPVLGVDGRTRRWVYLHYFKDGQPSINWLDPSFAGMKLVIGDALHSLGDLGATGLRLDANGFLGIERRRDDAPAWSEGHPLSIAANQLVAGMVRKAGGFTFQELNLSIDDIRAMSVKGSDLSYDFVARPAYHHALATGDTEFLRLMLTEAFTYGIDPASLVHALQNHDELTYELVHFWTVHQDDTYTFRGQPTKGRDLREMIRADLRESVTGASSPYNLLFTENGIACTTVSFITAVLGYTEPTRLSPEDIKLVRQAHLLLAMYNAWQPGVFALSGWDLTGALTIPRHSVSELVADGDTRWINRGAYDLLDAVPDAVASASGMPRAHSLYGSLPEQLRDETSFVSQLRRVLSVRQRFGVARARQVDIPPASEPGVLALVHELPADDAPPQVTVLNFSREPVVAKIRSTALARGLELQDAFQERDPVVVSGRNEVSLHLAPFAGACLTPTGQRS